MTLISAITSVPPAKCTVICSTAANWSSQWANLEQKRGYRFRGNVTLHSDDAIYDEQVAVAEHNGTKKPMTIPVLEITEIQDLTPGATAGKTIVKD